MGPEEKITGYKRGGLFSCSQFFILMSDTILPDTLRTDISLNTWGSFGVFLPYLEFFWPLSVRSGLCKETLGKIHCAFFSAC